MDPQPKTPRLGKPTPLEYGFLFGGPLVFLIIAWVFVTSFLGPPPAEGVVKRIRAGAVKSGMVEADVLKAVGEPKGRIDNADGSFTYRYQSSAWDPDRKEPLEEDAYIEFASAGFVTTISYASRVPTPTPAAPSP